VAGRLVFAVPGEGAGDEDAAAFGFGVGGELLPRQLRPPVGGVGFLHVGEVDVLFVQAPYRAGLLEGDRICRRRREVDRAGGAGADEPAHIPGVEGKVGGDYERAAVDGGSAADDRRAVARQVEAGVVAAEVVEGVAAVPGHSRLKVDRQDVVTTVGQGPVQVAADEPGRAGQEDSHRDLPTTI